MTGAQMAGTLLPSPHPALHPADDDPIPIDVERRIARFDPDEAIGPALDRYLDRIVREWAERPVAAAITAVVPVYDTDPALLHCTIESLCRQTVRPARILVADDGSQRADTCDYLAALARSPMVELHRNPRNLSLGPTMNAALALCRTPYALKLDSDDLARPELVARYVRHLDSEGAADVLGCQFTTFGCSAYTTAHPARITRDHALRAAGYWFVNHTGVLLNRDSVLASGGYRCLRGLAEDYDLWVRMMRRGFTRFRNLPESLVEYRDVPSGLHRNFKRGHNRLRLMAVKASLRLAPAF
jgi:glycosyltransferase involved in cell wall biosynthesis